MKLTFITRALFILIYFKQYLLNATIKFLVAFLDSLTNGSRVEMVRFDKKNNASGLSFVDFHQSGNDGARVSCTKLPQKEL